MLSPKEYNDKIISEFLELDGNRRDIYVDNTTIEDWSILLNELKKSNYQIRYSDGSNIYNLPEKVEQIFSDKASVHLLEVIEKSIFFNTYFYKEDQIEFDTDPKDFTELEQNRILYDFMRFIANTLNKKVKLTPEYAEESILMEILPGDDKIYINK